MTYRSLRPLLCRPSSGFFLRHLYGDATLAAQIQVWDPFQVYG